MWDQRTVLASSFRHFKRSRIVGQLKLSALAVCLDNRLEWRNMCGPPPNCKKNRFRREQSAKMYPASEWRVISGRMMMIRACLPLLIATVVKDLVAPQVFRHPVELCFRRSYLLQTPQKRISNSTSSSWKAERLGAGADSRSRWTKLPN